MVELKARAPASELVQGVPSCHAFTTPVASLYSPQMRCSEPARAPAIRQFAVFASPLTPMKWVDVVPRSRSEVLLLLVGELVGGSGELAQRPGDRAGHE